MPEPIPSGSGDSSSFVQIDFDGGVTALFEVSYNSASSLNTFDLLTTLDNDPNLPSFFLHTKSFVFGQFVFGLGCDGSIIDDADEDFGPTGWNFWVRDSLSQAWNPSFSGISSTTADDGDWHGFTNGVFPKGLRKLST